MQLIYIVLFLAVRLAAFSQAVDTVPHFERGNTLYNEGKFTEAIREYQKITDSGMHSAELYYNLGNAYYKLNDIANSIFYYEKALQLDPDDKDILNNLTYAQNAKIDVIDTLPKSAFQKYWRPIVFATHYDGWAWISVVLMIAFVVLFILYYQASSALQKRLFFTCAWIGLAFGILSMALAYQQYSILQKELYAIVFAPKAEVKSEPNRRSEEAFELHPGTKVRIIGSVEDWNKIRLSDGKEGWIPSEAIKKL